MEKQEAIRRLNDARVLLVLDGDGERAVEWARAAVDAGVWAVEVDERHGVGALAALVQAQLGCLPGAGGVASARRAWDAVEAGARFVAAEPLDAEIAAVCEAAAVPVIAVVGEGQSVEATLALRPDFLYLSAGSGSTLAGREDGPPLILQVGSADPATVQVVARAGARVVAVSMTLLAAGTPEDLKTRLRAVTHALESAR